jgi:hypothetical protein
MSEQPPTLKPWTRFTSRPRPTRLCLGDLFRKPFAKGGAEGLELSGRAALELPVRKKFDFGTPIVKG